MSNMQQQQQQQQQATAENEMEFESSERQEARGKQQPAANSSKQQPRQWSCHRHPLLLARVSP